MDSLDLSALIRRTAARPLPRPLRPALIAFIVLISASVIAGVLFALTPSDAPHRPLLAGLLLLLVATSGVAALTVLGLLLRDRVARSRITREQTHAELARLSGYGVPAEHLTRGDVLWLILLLSAAATLVVAWFMPLALLLGSVLFLLLLRQFFDRWIYGALFRAAYDQAQRGIDAAENWLPRPFNFAAQRGVVLTYSGRIDEAVTIFEAQMGRAAQSGDPRAVRLALNNLGYALLVARRHADALPLLESAIRLDPRNPAPYGSLAAYYLDQQIEPMRALEVAEFALEHTPRLDDFTHHVLIALTGIARARMHQPGQDALVAVLRFADHHASQPERAILYVMAAQMLHDPRAAREHLVRARTLDPHGYAGRAALALLVGSDVGSQQ